FAGRRVDEEPHRRDVRRQQPAQPRGLTGVERARALRVEDEADRIGTQRNGRSHVFGMYEAAKLDACPDGHKKHSRTSSPHDGTPKDGSYCAPSRYRPSGENVAAACRRSRPSSTSPTQAGLLRPSPTASKVPIRLRIM